MNAATPPARHRTFHSESSDWGAASGRSTGIRIPPPARPQHITIRKVPANAQTGKGHQLASRARFSAGMTVVFNHSRDDQGQVVCLVAAAELLNEMNHGV